MIMSGQSVAASVLPTMIPARSKKSQPLDHSQGLLLLTKEGGAASGVKIEIQGITTKNPFR